MKSVFSYRANRILYNFIKSNGIKGDVIIPANLCHSVVDTLLFAGLNLSVVDISKETLCADESQVLERVAEASMLIFVHTYGVESACPEWFSDVRRLNSNIAIVDDRCLCLPQLSLNESTADLVLYSCCSKKQVDLGIGGIGHVSDRWKYEDNSVACNPVLTNDSWTPDYHLIERRAFEVIKHKASLNEVYSKSLPAEFQLKDGFQQWRFNIVVPHKEKVLQRIFDAGLFASSHYKPLSVSCPVATDLQMQVINLFNDFYYSIDQARQTCEIINRVICE